MEASDTKAAARTLGLDFVSLEIRRREDIPTTFEALQAKVDAIYIVSDALIATNRTRIITLALNRAAADHLKLPRLCGSWRTHVLRPELRRPFSGDPPTQSTRSCAGRSQGDIPVEQASKFELVINRATAKTLGVQIPTTLLAIADEVIE